MVLDSTDIEHSQDPRVLLDSTGVVIFKPFGIFQAGSLDVLDIHRAGTCQWSLQAIGITSMGRL